MQILLGKKKKLNFRKFLVFFLFANVRITFWKIKVKANLTLSSFSWTKALKKACLRFVIFNCSEKLIFFRNRITLQWTKGTKIVLRKKKKYLAICSTVLCCCSLWSTGEVPFQKLSTVEYIFGRTLKKRRLVTSIIQTLRKKLKRCNKFKVLALRARAPRFFGKKKVYEKPLCACWFFTKKLIILSPFAFFFFYHYWSFYRHDFRMITL